MNKSIYVLGWDNDSSIEILEDTATRTGNGTWQIIGDTGSNLLTNYCFEWHSII